MFSASTMKDGQVDGISRVRPSMAGVDADAVVTFLDEARDEKIDLHSLLVYRRGHLAVEAYRWPFRADRPRIIHSVTKSFTACGIGLAIAEERFALTDKVVSFFPEHLPPIVDDKLAAMTVQDLLTMRTGHAEETSGSRWRVIDTSWIAEFLKIPVVYAPGSVYVYTSAASYMLSAILSRATGKTLHEYLKPRLFQPLGITGEMWDMGPDGINPGGNGLTCRSIDLLKLGVLHAQKGVWNGIRLLPESWIAEATRSFGDSDYGYHWVTGPNGEFYAMGLFGQMIAVFPEYDAVMVMTSATGGSHPCSGQILPMMQRHIQSMFPERVLNSDNAHARLETRLAEMTIPETLVSLSEPSPEYSGALQYEVPDNPLGIRGLSLDLSREACTLRLTDAAGEHTIAAGINRWIEGETDVRGEQLHHGYHLTPARVVAGARWLTADTLEMTWIFAETAFRDTVLCHFAGNRLTLSRSVNVNSSALKLPDVEALKK
jgi:CubicO group peptidase (beta-lactamase class C family)